MSESSPLIKHTSIDVVSDIPIHFQKEKKQLVNRKKSILLFSTLVIFLLFASGYYALNNGPSDVSRVSPESGRQPTSDTKTEIGIDLQEQDHATDSFWQEPEIEFENEQSTSPHADNEGDKDNGESGGDGGDEGETQSCIKEYLYYMAFYGVVGAILLPAVASIFALLAGFLPAGILAGSFAAYLMFTLGPITAAGGFIAMMQSIGVLGISSVFMPPVALGGFIGGALVGLVFAASTTVGCPLIPK